MRSDNLKNHIKIHDRKRKFPCNENDYRNQITIDSSKQKPYKLEHSEKDIIPNDIPTFDGAEFSSTKPKSRRVKRYTE